MARALIFGGLGQDGHYLSRLLRETGIEVISVSRSGGNYSGSVADFTFVEGLVKRYRPDFVFHFAANSKSNGWRDQGLQLDLWLSDSLSV